MVEAGEDKLDFFEALLEHGELSFSSMSSRVKTSPSSESPPTVGM